MFGFVAVVGCSLGTGGETDEPSGATSGNDIVRCDNH